MVSIDDPSVLAKIISLALDQSIRDYANLSRVSHLFLCLSKQYLEHEIKNPPKKTTGKEYTVIIGVGQITFTTKDTFVIYIADPHDKKQTLFNWSIKGRFESRNSKHSETIENICRTALYPWELVKFYDSLRNKISNSIAQYWKDIEAEKEKDLRPTHLQRYKLAQAKAKQRAIEEFKHWRLNNNFRFRHANPDRHNADVFSDSDFCLASFLPKGF